MIGVTLATLLLIYLFFRFTPLGLAMRAAAQNPDASRLVGIRVGWMLALGWGLAGAIGAIAAIMAAPIVYIEPNMMAGILLYGFAAALLGGINNPWGAPPGDSSSASSRTSPVPTWSALSSSFRSHW
jgi:Branched-chain amino acid ABC-type transport system, permease components